MPKPMSADGKRNLTGENLRRLRREYGLSQRELAERLQLTGLDMDKNAIMRIETNRRYVTDVELRAFSLLFGVSPSELMGMEENGK